MRTVPCMAGGEGPMLRGKGSVGGSGASPSCGSWIPTTTRREAGGASVLSTARVPLLRFFGFLGSSGSSESVDRIGLAAHERLPLLFGVVLAQRGPDELRGHEDAGPGWGAL